MLYDEVFATDLWVLLVVVLLSAYPPADEVIADSVRQRQVVITIRRHIAILDDGVVNMSTERLLHVRHVLNQGDASHADLLAPVLICLWLRSHHEKPNQVYYIFQLVVLFNSPKI